MIDGLIKKLSPDAFMKLLPELRQAFGYFTPLETDRIAGKAAALHGVKSRNCFRAGWSLVEEYEYGEALDAYASQAGKKKEGGGQI